MKKKSDDSCEDQIAVSVSRFGHDPVPVCVPEGATVEEVLEKAEIELNGREEIFVAGVKADMDSEVEDKDILSIVTPKQAGAR